MSRSTLTAGVLLLVNRAERRLMSRAHASVRRRFRFERALDKSDQRLLRLMTEEGRAEGYDPDFVFGWVSMCRQPKEAWIVPGRLGDLGFAVLGLATVRKTSIIRTVDLQASGKPQ
jgi:hypothetical protein